MPLKPKTNSWFPLHDNAPTHRRVLIKDFLANGQCDGNEASFIQYDLDPADFYLFPKMKSALKGRRFCNVTDVLKNATKELKSFHKIASRNISNNFTAAGRSVCFHKGIILKEMWLKLLYHFVFFKNLVIPETI
jgi:hypothetical protein